MEQGDEYWMLMKRRQLLKSDFQNNSINDDSWEERCFAGGCIWPPRCYSCSFCKREFRSAQALGGHMNVHRRDRAKLKQSLNTNQNHIDYDHLPNSTLTSSKLSAFSIIQQNLNIPNPTNVETDLFMGSNSVPSTPKTAVSPLSFFINPCSTDIYSIQSEVTQPDSTSMEDIDLELRLGDPPRVN